MRCSIAMSQHTRILSHGAVKRHFDDGFTLVELLITMSIVALVLSVAYKIFDVGNRTWTASAERNRLIAASDIFSARLQSEIRQARVSTDENPEATAYRNDSIFIREPVITTVSDTVNTSAMKIKTYDAYGDELGIYTDVDDDNKPELVTYGLYSHTDDGVTTHSIARAVFVRDSKTPDETPWTYQSYVPMVTPGTTALNEPWEILVPNVAPANSPAPTVFLPTQGQILPFGDIDIKWVPILGSSGYRIRIRNNNTGVTLPDILVGADVSSYQIPQTSLVAGHYYIIRVSAVTDMSPAWSSDLGFTPKNPIAGAPILTSPSQGQEIELGDIDILWSSVAGATGYRIDVRDSGGATLVVEDKTDSTLSHHIQQESLAEGHTYVAKVAALSGNPPTSPVWGTDVAFSIIPTVTPVDDIPVTFRVTYMVLNSRINQRRALSCAFGIYDSSDSTRTRALQPVNVTAMSRTN